MATKTMAPKTKDMLKGIGCFICLAFLLNTDHVSAAKTSKAPSYPVLVLDVSGDPKLPDNFRTSTTLFPQGTDNPPPRTGLDNLNASGSAQFTGSNLIRMITAINLPAGMTGYIVDLRKESHGFLDNTPVSWYGFWNLDNKDRSPDAVYNSEKNALSVLDTQRKTTAYQMSDRNGQLNFAARRLSFRNAYPEQALVANNSNFKYMRFYVLDGYPPDNTQIDAFVEFVKSLKEPTWLHFHDLAGVGRATTFLALYDIIRNAKQVSLDTILKRQKLIGGLDLQDTTGLADWEVPIAQKRLHVINSFYNYVIDPEGYDKRSYSEWQDFLEGKVKKKSIFSVIGF